METKSGKTNFLSQKKPIMDTNVDVNVETFISASVSLVVLLTFANR